MKEYLTTREVADKFEISMKSVQRKVKAIVEETDTKLIIKDGTQWLIHQLAVPRFKPRAEPYTALTIDTCVSYTSADLKKIVEAMFNACDAVSELSYSIETKRKNNKPHIHCYLLTKELAPFLKVVKVYIDFGYHHTPIYDLEGWQVYISKESPIIKLKK